MNLAPKDPELDSVVGFEQNYYQEGYEDGYNDGLVSGKRDGLEVGLKTGFEVGEELGFYQGCVDVWLSSMKVAPGTFSHRLKKSIEQLRVLVGNYPVAEPENELVQDMMEAIRLKFRIISANLGVKLEYDGYHKSSKMGIEEREFFL